jgi:FkbM family methyltransferase
MNDFFDNINKNEIGKLIHVGAGTGIDLKDYVTQSFVEILLLEPIPKVFKQLESKIEKLNKINVHCNITALNVALSSCADATKEKTFYITLPIRYSSLHKADKLKILFQNLKTEQEITVSTINFSDLINQASLDTDKKNALVLQINGAEFDVLAQAKTDELMLFSSIVIQHSNNNYFENAKTSTDLIALMKSKGFQLAIEADVGVVFSSLVFRKDESTLKIKVLTEQNKTHTVHIDELKAELENQLKASNDTKAKKMTEAKVSSEQSKAYQVRISELEAQLNEENITNTIRIEELTKEKDNQTYHHHEKKQWAESLRLQIKQCKADLEERSRSVNLGQKIIAKAHSDLDNLRKSYRGKVESEKELVKLINELREKLTLASSYYQQLQQEHPEILLTINNTVQRS